MTSLVDTSTTSSRKGGTISNMVERFRFASPMSREEREKQRLNSSNGGTGLVTEFWWTRKDGIPPTTLSVDISGRDNIETGDKPIGQSVPAVDDGSLHASFASYLSDSSVSTSQQPQYRYASGTAPTTDAA
jgi:hypothetical protein